MPRDYRDPEIYFARTSWEILRPTLTVSSRSSILIWRRLPMQYRDSVEESFTDRKAVEANGLNRTLIQEFEIISNF